LTSRRYRQMRPFGRRRRCWGNSGRATPSFVTPARRILILIVAGFHLDCRAADVPRRIGAWSSRSLEASYRSRLSCASAPTRQCPPAIDCCVDAIHDVGAKFALGDRSMASMGKRARSISSRSRLESFTLGLLRGNSKIRTRIGSELVRPQPAVFPLESGRDKRIISRASRNAPRPFRNVCCWPKRRDYACQYLVESARSAISAAP